MGHVSVVAAGTGGAKAVGRFLAPEPLPERLLFAESLRRRTRAITFCANMAGFELDVDYRPNDQFRVVQLTPPGWACSIQFATGIGTYLVVSDIEVAHRDLAARGLRLGPLRHKASRPDWQGSSSPAGLARRNRASFFDFADLDGNSWTIQERGRLEK